jgi:hypothetical protein
MHRDAEMVNTIWFWPMATLIAWTAVAWIALYVQRFSEMRERRIDPQRLFNRKARVDILRRTSAADNFNNLLELPTLFHLAMLVALVVAGDDALLLRMAWVYVALRVLHSLVHITYNRVVHRFAAYAASTLVLFAIWVRLAMLVAA